MSTHKCPSQPCAEELRVYQGDQFATDYDTWEHLVKGHGLSYEDATDLLFGRAG